MTTVLDEYDDEIQALLGSDTNTLEVIFLQVYQEYWNLSIPICTKSTRKKTTWKTIERCMINKKY